jgi:flagellar M-ring protein FliF
LDELTQEKKNMSPSFAETLKQLRGILHTMSAGKMIVLFLVVAGSVAGMVVLIAWSASPDMAPLYTHLAPEDAGQVVAVLKEKKISYRLSHDGATVLIPRDRLYETRFELASKGLPRSGTGFEIFDNVKLVMTEFVQNINYQRALQGELSRTINGLSEVESSRVHIVMHERSLFIADEEPASASVILKLRAGRWLNEDQIQGIVHLVSSSVPRLSPKGVTVVDHNGKMLAGLNDQPSMTKMSADHLDFQQKKERLLEKRILTMLEAVLGRDKAIVRVACDLDFVQQEKTEEMFLPDNQVVRSENLSSETSTESDRNAIGVPGLASNISRSPAQGTEAGIAKGFQKEDKTRNYEIGKTISRKIMPVGQLQRLSVSVIVDGTYKTVASGGDDSPPEVQYIARSAEEMMALENIVKSAVNYDLERGDMVHVANIAFKVDDARKEKETEVGSALDRIPGLGSYIKYLLLGIFLMFVFAFIIRPLIRWLTETPWEDVELLEHLPRSLSEIEKQYAGQIVSDNYVKQAAKLMATQKEDSGRLMKKWLKES